MAIFNSKQIQKFERELYKNISKNNILTDPLSRHAYANDASHYLLIPQIVVIVDSESEVKWVFFCANKFHIPITIRAAGSSLSGQAVSEYCLMVISWKWHKYSILDNGNYINLQPGIIASEANFYLKKYQKKIGPDPSSIDFAKIGGIVANNASGMCCGTKYNSYQTLKHIRVILIDGTILDTSSIESKDFFNASKKHIVEKIETIREKINNNKELKQKIKSKYNLKNTVGYSLNAFIDYHNPIDIISHLFVGSEGTLGYISEVCLQTIYDAPFKSAAMFVFPSAKTAMETLKYLNLDSISSLEFLDYFSLLCAKNEIKEYIPDNILLNSEKNCVLILDIRSKNKEENFCIIEQITSELKAKKNYIFHTAFFSDHNYGKIMQIRKSILPVVQAQRSENAICLLEDIAFPIDTLGTAIEDLYSLFQTYSFKNACVFGHAKDGNLHFLIEINFNNKVEIEKYALFMDELAKTVIIKYNGSLKAEHGTGRNIAPFIEIEWGKEATAIMQEIKEIFDPKYYLNPDVILTRDNKIHLKHLKSIASVDPLFDKCNECGNCERVCPSTGYTLTPRQRIVSLRAIDHANKQNNVTLAKFMLKEFKFKGSDTCAASSMCATVCPVKVDTGNVIKIWRKQNRHYFFYPILLLISKFHFLVPIVGKVFLLLKGKLP